MLKLSLSTCLVGVVSALVVLTALSDPPLAYATDCPGPDSFGYVCFDLMTTNFPAGTTDIGNHCDDCVTAIALPFAFNFYGTNYTTANVSSNGNLQFASSVTDFFNTALPNAAFNDAIFVFWDDLSTAGTGFGIFTATFGTAPNRQFSIEWRTHVVGGTTLVNFAILLFETSGNIDYYYGNTSGNNGASATLGIQRGTGSVSFLQRSFNSAVLVPGFELVLEPTADLSVAMTGPATASAGTNVTYTITLTNGGPDTSRGTIVLRDTVPLGAAFDSVSQTAGPAASCSVVPNGGGTDDVNCSIPGLPAGAIARFTLVLSVMPGTANGTVITNQALLGFFLTDDPNFSNNHATVSTTIGNQLDLSVAQTDTPDPVTAGNNVTYTITVQNPGPSEPLGVQLTDTVPANTTFVSGVQTAGTTFSCSTPPVGGTGTFSCSTSTIPSGATAVFRLVVNTSPSTTPGSTITNTATITGGTADPTPANNSATATTTVLGANLGVTNSAAPNPVLQGQTVTFTFTASNPGPNDAQSFQLASNVPANTAFVSETHPAGFACTAPTVGGTGPITCTRSTFVAGVSAVFTVVVRLNVGTPADTAITNTAMVSSTTPDPSAANNTATATASAARQNVGVQVTPSSGRLQSTITARNAGCGPNDNQLLSLHFTRTDNATVDVLGQVGRSGDFTVPVNPPVQQVSFFINRLTAGQAATVRLIVTDGCGTWETLAGGGNNAFPPADAPPATAPAPQPPASPTSAPAPQPSASPTPAGPARVP